MKKYRFFQWLPLIGILLAACRQTPIPERQEPREERVSETRAEEEERTLENDPDLKVACSPEKTPSENIPKISPWAPPIMEYPVYAYYVWHNDSSRMLNIQVKSLVPSKSFSFDILAGQSYQWLDNTSESGGFFELPYYDRIIVSFDQGGIECDLFRILFR